MSISYPERNIHAKFEHLTDLEPLEKVPGVGVVLESHHSV